MTLCPISLLFSTFLFDKNTTGSAFIVLRIIFLKQILDNQITCFFLFCSIRPIGITRRKARSTAVTSVSLSTAVVPPAATTAGSSIVPPAAPLAALKKKTPKMGKGKAPAKKKKKAKKNAKETVVTDQFVVSHVASGKLAVKRLLLQHICINPIISPLSNSATYIKLSINPPTVDPSSSGHLSTIQSTQPFTYHLSIYPFIHPYINKSYPLYHHRIRDDLIPSIIKCIQARFVSLEDELLDAMGMIIDHHR